MHTKEQSPSTKFSVMLKGQLTPNGKIQMRCLGEYLRAHYNPHCLEAAAFVSPVKRCNDSIYYVYQVPTLIIILSHPEQFSESTNRIIFKRNFASKL